MKTSAPMAHMAKNLENKYTRTPGMLPFIREAEKAVKAVEGLERLAVTKNPLDTEAAHIKKLHEASKRLGESLNNITNRVGVSYNERVDFLNQQIVAGTELAPTAFAAEIREVLRSKPLKERAQILSSAVKNEDSETLAAILEGNDLTTGINSNIRKQFIDSYKRTKMPEAFEEIEAMDEVLSTVLELTSLGSKAADSVCDPVYIADLQSLEDRAKEAADEFDTATERGTTNEI